MKKSFKIAIPNPCHENWQTMTPNEKGRFCDSCSKTVVDFTQMDPSEIQYYLVNNKSNRVCGHIKQSQLNSLNLRIPSEVFQKKMSPIRFFSLALLVVMGSSIMSCTGQNGKPNKINSVEVIDSTYLKIDTSFSRKKDSITEVKKLDNTIQIEEIPLEGELIITGIMIEENEFTDHIVPYNIVDILPEFIKTPKQLTRERKKKYFYTKISAAFSSNLRKLSEQHRKVFIKFEIDSLGYVQNIQSRPNEYKKPVKDILTSLPPFIPGKNNGKNVAVSFTLPILFKNQ